MLEKPLMVVERKSAPPTLPSGFKLLSDERGSIRSKNSKDLHNDKQYVFKARQMPNFPDPPSPSRKSIASSMTHFEFSEFNLHTDKRQRERLSLPIMTTSSSMRSVSSHGGALAGFVA